MRYEEGNPYYWWSALWQEHEGRGAGIDAEHESRLCGYKVWDEEFRERVRRHQERRGPEWTNIEEELYLSRHHLTGRVVVIDCVTLWLTNFFFSHDEDVNRSLEAAKQEFDAFTAPDATYIFVTNEIGMGGVSDNVMQRKFSDLQGWMNQYIASKADEVILMVSGIPVKIK